ncbi:methyltransferase domain-containing protein, partial [bacterium]|nr:methyltransferase domain-containing protein [bacterium]
MVGEFKSEWDKSYKNKDNYIFYPHEEIIRFISKYIRKRVGLDEFIDQCEINESTKVLDFGCGIGRHMRLLYEFGLNARGFDLSSEAITVAKNNFSSLGM